MTNFTHVILRPHSGWQPINLQELWSRRELLGFLVWRDIKIRYKQTLFGGAWALLQPLLPMVIFTVFFNRMVGIQTDGPPYPLFAYSGLVLWTFFANAISLSSNSLVGNQALVSKVYFPRVFIPLATIGALLLDFALGLLLMFVLMAYYGWPLLLSSVLIPLYLIGVLLAASGVGLILSALNVWFRDVKYVVPFFIQMGLFVSPVIYPLQYIPSHYQLLLELNPITGMIVGFRHSILGGSVDWRVVVISSVTCILLFILGLFSFRRMERRFADII